ncbi:MAG: prepilin peptidase [Candidatus Obscuribacterales bacterium]|nr:prepilin peptidase [Candidatus Obscuribacterales bacterium]
MTVAADIFGNHPFVTCVGAFFLGLCFGSFLNVVALRSLKEQSVWWPPSHCPQCEHALSPWDNIPLLSYLLLGGRCRYCRNSISWQYPVVELATGLVFCAIAYVFLVLNLPFDGQAYANGASLYESIKAGILQHSYLAVDADGFSPIKLSLVLGLVALACTLIAVTVTDFRERLIPHEITYPSMLLGLLFSAIVRKDLLGALAGAGASYIIFDFLAFYGLKFYLSVHGEDGEAVEEKTIDEELDGDLGLPEAQTEEPIEVMGGGDAVLAAVLSAYLGWQMLVVVLVVGFLSGTLMGLVLLFKQMKIAGILGQGIKRGFTWGLIAGAFVSGLFLVFQTVVLQQALSGELFGLSIMFALLSVFSFLLLGIISVGSQVSKPFPFGPALALGGFVAIFLIPFWLPFN